MSQARRAIQATSMGRVDAAGALEMTDRTAALKAARSLLLPRVFAQISRPRGRRCSSCCMASRTRPVAMAQSQRIVRFMLWTLVLLASTAGSDVVSFSVGLGDTMQDIRCGGEGRPRIDCADRPRPTVPDQPLSCVHSIEPAHTPRRPLPFRLPPACKTRLTPCLQPKRSAAIWHHRPPPAPPAPPPSSPHPPPPPVR